jgi:hypothetical protein
MGEQVEITTVDATNVDEYGFFCYKSKPKSAGYQQKLAWLRERFAEGMRIQILYEGKRSVGGVFQIVYHYNGELLCYHYLGKKEVGQLTAQLTRQQEAL